MIVKMTVSTDSYNVIREMERGQIEPLLIHGLLWFVKNVEPVYLGTRFWVTFYLEAECP